MSDKTALWDRLGRTDPAHTKKFKRAGGFEGTAIKPMWSYRMMTEEFGPCGKGWGINQPKFDVVPATEGEILVYCTVSVWYETHDQMAFGVGGDKVVGKNKFGLSTDDEAFKKAYTDAVTNALKMIGVGADVHMGMFDDSKYVNAVAKEFDEGKKAAAAPAKQDAPKAITAADQKRQLEAINDDLLDAHSEVGVKRLVDIWATIAERDGWSSEYWNEARRRFAAKRASFDKPVTDAEALQHPMNA
ncbi:hypothetical protein G9X67_34695 [Rhizobium sp. WYCCWR 11152]|uniref:hypothetical protein n=1 Tax=Rhizobium sp. WYCCWR 11152 TaxID=2692316 RepID=UPI001492BE2D|nr:hypothetical protein [Rhizobium sp. WYCCWR 11152]NNU70402.1 hypothetical protein [Rhizobium sp. WYCCWR 11152]